ncbi:MAG: hypothetical protein O2955_07570, partial [Planctomycetota bacterium]|nr:hypothetical protein [Planctomycetota bacterium]
LHQRGCVERTFAWIGSGHRYSNDYEQIPSISEIMRPKDEQEIPSAIEIALSAAIDGVPSDVG